MNKETPEERQQRFRAIRESIANQLMDDYPNVELDWHKYGIDIITYFPSYSDGIKVSKHKRAIHTTTPNLQSHYLTKSEAIKAISLFEAPAFAKFQECLKAFTELQSSLGFEVSYIVEGDTHGVDDWPYIYFEMGGFEFSYRIEN